MSPTAITLLLVTFLSGNSPNWSWQRSPSSESVTSYTIYWRSPATEWCSGYSATFIEPNNCGLSACGDVNKCCGETTNPERELGATLLFFVATARNAFGDSPTEHGVVLETCP